MSTLDTQKIEAEILKLLAETAKVNKELKWYEYIVLATIISGFTLAIVAVTKLFL